jgi:hypothetical protein
VGLDDADAGAPHSALHRHTLTGARVALRSKGDLSGVKADISEMKVGFANVDVRFNRLERKLDRCIETQSKTTRLVKRR